MISKHCCSTKQANEFVVSAHNTDKINKRSYEQRFQDLVKLYNLQLAILPYKARWNKHVKDRVTEVSVKNANKRIQNAHRLKNFYPTQRNSGLKPYLQIRTFRGRKLVTKARLYILALNEYTQAWNATGTELCEMEECGGVETLEHFLLECEGGMAERRKVFFSKLEGAFRTELSGLTSDTEKVKTLIMHQGRYTQERTGKEGDAGFLAKRTAYTILLGGYLSDLWKIRADAKGQIS